MASFEAVEHDPFAAAKPRLEPVDDDPFAKGPVQKLEPVEHDPFATPLPRARPEEAGTMTAAVAVAPLPRERPEGAGPRPPQEMPPVTPLEGAVPPPQPGAIARGFTTGSLKENPEMGAEALEMASHLGPEQFKESLLSASKDLHAVAKRSPAAYATQSKGLWNIGSLEDLDTYVGETLGQVLASSVPSAATGAVGAFVGGRAAGKPGAIGGGIAGALGPSYGLNSGEIYKALKDAGVSGEAAAPWAATAGAMTTALDVGSLGTIVGVLGAKKVKSELNKEIATRIATAVAAGAGTESVTEMVQDTIKHAAVSLKAGKPFWTVETGKEVIESGVGGLIGGGVLGGSAGVVKTVLPGGVKVGPDGVPIPEQAVVTPEDIAAQVAAGGVSITPTQQPPPLPPTPGSAAAPMPTETPVTTVEGGVKTTTTLHGPKGAYEVGADPATAAPTLKPATQTTGEILPPEPGRIRFYHGTAYEDASGFEGSTFVTPHYDYAKNYHGGPNNVLYTDLTKEEAIARGLYDEINGFPINGSITDGAAILKPTKLPPTVPLAAERESVPVEGLYSRLQRWVSEKGPAKLPAHEWKAKLQKGDSAFKKEEVQDLQLEAYLEGRRGQNVTKEELLTHAAAMTAPLVEVTRTPLTREEMAAQKSAIERQIRIFAASNLQVMNQETGGINLEHPLLAPFVDQYTNLTNAEEWAQYEQYTTPGPRDSYTELTLHLPHRGATVAPATRPSPGTVAIVGEDVYGSHYAEPNEVASIRLTRRTGINGESIALLEEGQSDVLQALKAGAPVPDAVYKEGWPALAVTRFLMWAAREGITHIAWVNSAEQMRRYPQGTKEQVAARQRGMEHFYDRVVPSIMKRWARDLGGTIGTTMIPDNQYRVALWNSPVTGLPMWGVFPQEGNVGRPIMTANTQVEAEEYAQRNTRHSTFGSMVLPQSAVDTINSGMPSYSREEVSNSEGASLGTTGSTDTRTQQAVEPLTRALNSLIKKLNLGIGVKVVVHEDTITYQIRNTVGQLEWVRKHNTLGTARYLGVPAGKPKSALTSGEIHVAVRPHKTAEGLWATMTHELGHLVMVTTFQRTSDKVKGAILASYQEFYKKTHPDVTMEELVRMQSNAAFIIERVLSGSPINTTMLNSLTAEKQEYWRGFSEWFAEQVAKWATTSEPALSHVDKFFAGMAKVLRMMLKAASDMFGFQYEPNKELKAFLDSFLTSDVGAMMGPQMATATTQATTVANAAQMEPEDTPVAAQPETAAGMDGINGVFDGRPPKEAQQAKAYADKFNWMWKTFTGIHQLAAANRHITALQDYVEIVKAAKLVKQNIMIRAEEVLRMWNKLGETQADAVSKLLDEVQYMTYLSDDEKKAKVARHPTQAELLALAQKHGVSRAGLAVFAEVSKSFQEHLMRLEDVLRRDAMKMSDTIQRDLKLAGITKHMAALRAKPYFPSMRFGSYTLVVRDAAGKMKHFETFENERTRRSAMRAIQSALDPADVMQVGFLDKTVRPLLGVPTQLLEMMGEKLKLNDLQKDALEQLKFELSPAESFRHRFQHKKLTAGYSMDFRRAYAKYFFHGANHLMKAQYADRLRALTKMAKAEVANEPDITKRQKIVAYMTAHTDAWLDPKPDWAGLSSVAFTFHLAWSAAAATQNMTQTLITSHPFLSAKFGFANSVAALAKAGRGIENFYRKRTLEKHTSFEQKALFQGMEDGVIKETQAPELAGYANGDTLGKGFGGNPLQRAFVKFNEWGAFMFEMSEQFNRRLVFRAALDLAQKYPSARYVREAVARQQLVYQKVRAMQWTEAQAAAYVTALDAVSETQFEYGKEFAPRVMRGRARSVLVFKTFQQSYFMFLVNNRDARLQSLVILAFLGGFMGAPFAEELKQLLKIIGWMAFGKDFDLAHEARKLIIEALGEKNGGMTADLVLHGTAKRGFGLHDAGDMLFGTHNPVPMFDRSKAVGFGGFLPVELDKLFGPPLQTVDKAIAQQSQKASGAVFGTAFAAYSALRDTQLSWSDAKRWEAIMPRAMRNVSTAIRGAVSGGERTKNGGQIIEYDVRDPQGAAEVIGMGMGYAPYRKNYEWEKAMAKHDAAKMVDIRRTQIMGQFGNAVLGKDPEERAKMTQAVRDFNASLEGPEKAKAITSDSLTKSVETRARDRALKERGLSAKTSDIPIYRDVEEKLFPESNRTLRKVKSGLTP